MSETERTRLRIEMSAKQLASLNLLIGFKQAGSHKAFRLEEDGDDGGDVDFADQIANVAGEIAVNAAQAAVGTIAVTQAEIAAPFAAIALTAAGVAAFTHAIGQTALLADAEVRRTFVNTVQKMSLDDLIKIRNSAIVKNG